MAKQLEVELGIIRVEVEQVIALAVATAGIILPSLQHAGVIYVPGEREFIGGTVSFSLIDRSSFDVPGQKQRWKSSKTQSAVRLLQMHRVH